MSETVAFVTGGASGLGAATVARIAEAGGRVLSYDLSAAGSALDGAYNGRVKFVRGDVTDEQTVNVALDEAIECFGRIGAVVACAGISIAAKVVGRKGPFPLADFARVINVNLIGTFNVLRLAAERMMANTAGPDGERGVIICTSSGAAYEGQIGQAAYSASKAGIAGIILPAARELGASGIRVVGIAPGLFDTPLLSLLPPDARARLAETIPFPKRLGGAEEFARLTTDIIENRMLNGTTIRLDGAYRLPSQ